MCILHLLTELNGQPDEGSVVQQCFCIGVPLIDNNKLIDIMEQMELFIQIL